MSDQSQRVTHAIGVVIGAAFILCMVAIMLAVTVATIRWLV